MTCHRGSELRFGHYTSYVKAPNGTWYHADDEDMTQVSLYTVQNDHTAYLLSYIRVNNPDAEFGSTNESPINPSRPMQNVGKSASNGHSVTESNDTRYLASVNGYRPTIISDGHSPPIKRKREDDQQRDEERDSKRPANMLTIPPSPLRITTFQDRNAPDQYSTDSPEELPSKFGYNPKSRHDDRRNTQHNLSPQKKNKGDKYANRSNDRDKGRGSGPPMPYAQGTYRGGGSGFQAKSRGVWSRMKGRPGARS